MELIVSIVGVVVAFAIGLFAEPVRLYLADLHKRQYLRKALYKEMNFMYARMLSISNASMEYDWDTYKKSLQTIARFECYDYAKANPMLLYQLPDASAINQVYANFRTYLDGFLFKDVEEHIRNAQAVANTVEGLLVNGELDRRLFLKSCDKDSRAILDQRLKQLQDLSRFQHK